MAYKIHPKSTQSSSIAPNSRGANNGFSGIKSNESTIEDLSKEELKKQLTCLVSFKFEDVKITEDIKNKLSVYTKTHPYYKTEVMKGFRSVTTHLYKIFDDVLDLKKSLQISKTQAAEYKLRTEKDIQDLRRAAVNPQMKVNDNNLRAGIDARDSKQALYDKLRAEEEIQGLKKLIQKLQFEANNRLASENELRDSKKALTNPKIKGSDEITAAEKEIRELKQALNKSKLEAEDKLKIEKENQELKQALEKLKLEADDKLKIEKENQELKKSLERTEKENKDLKKALKETQIIRSEKQNRLEDYTELSSNPENYSEAKNNKKIIVSNNPSSSDALIPSENNTEYANFQNGHKTSYTNTSLNWASSAPQMPGLPNKGNTCFINSVLQMLAHMPSILDDLKHEPSVASLYNVVRAMHNKSQDLNNLLDIFLYDLFNNSDFQRGRCGDPKFLILRLLKNMPALIVSRRTLKFTHKKSGKPCITEYPVQTINFFQTFTQGHNLKRILENCFKDNLLECKAEQVSATCTNCNLIYTGQESVSNYFKSKYIIFSFIQGSVSVNLDEVQVLIFGTVKLILYCIIQRIGMGSESGHNFCVCKVGNSWVQYNDSRVTKLINDRVVTDSYLLVYS